MKTSHQFARELLALPDLPIAHLDPSYAHVGEGSHSLTEPKAAVNTVDCMGDPLPPEQQFVEISGTQDPTEPDYGGLVHHEPDSD